MLFPKIEPNRTGVFVPKSATVPPTVLIVEDEMLIRLMAEDYLRADGFRTLTAASASEAIDNLEQHPEIRFLFGDVRIADGPGSLDGQELAALVRDRWPPIGIILTSAYFSKDTVRMPLRNVFIPKPYSLDRVARTFRSMHP